MITQIPYEQFQKLYATHIATEFGRMERRPLTAIRALYQKGQYCCYVHTEKGRLQAYACFVQAQGIGGVLLDYFAVVPALRGGGVGSHFLGWLQKNLAGSEHPPTGIIIESELPEKAKTEADEKTRRRRIAFYQRAGAQLCPCGWQVFGVDYNLLWLPVAKPLAQANPAGDIKRLYALTMPRFLAKTQTRLYLLR